MTASLDEQPKRTDLRPADMPPVPAAARTPLSAAEAQLLGFSAVALVNQGLIATQSLPGSGSASVLHHAYDAGQVLALGLLSFAVFEWLGFVARRLELPSPSMWRRALALACACIAVCLLTVRGDVANAAVRYGVPTWFATGAAALTFACVIGGTALLRPLRHPIWVALIGCAGIVLAVLNGLVLPGDYPALHLMLAWLAALLLAQVAEQRLPSLQLWRLPRRAALVVLALVCAGAVVVPPRQDVLRRLYTVPSSIVAPFAARFYPPSPGPDLTLVPHEFLRSPWFQDRSRLSPIPASDAWTLPDPKIVLLLSIDATRADVVSNPEFVRDLPALRALRESSAYFSQARTAASSTRPAIASLFTGRYFTQLFWSYETGVAHLADAGPRLPELLSGAGVRTVSLPLFKRISFASGVGRGFETEISKRLKADGIVDEIIDLLKEARDRPTFLYAHFGEPHAPYRGTGTPFQRYLQEVGRVDAALLRLRAFLEESGLAKRTLLIVTSDHGEGFREHGVRYHARIVYEEVARIPLLIHGPGIEPREISEPVSLIDLTPTLLDVFGLPTPPTFMGQSLLPLIAGQSKKLQRAIAIFATHGLEALYLPDGKKVILDFFGRTAEVYDLVKDPGELVNLIENPTPEVHSALETARLFFEVHRSDIWQETVAEPPEDPGP